MVHRPWRHQPVDPMTRRAFVALAGVGAAANPWAATLARQLGGGPAPLGVVQPRGRRLGDFPNVTRPCVLGLGERGVAHLVHTEDETLLRNGTSGVSLGRLERARAVVDPRGNLHVAALRDEALWLVRVNERLEARAVRLAKVGSPHPAAGLDVAWTPEGVRVVAPGAEPRTMALYTDKPDARPLLLTVHAPTYPLLRYDARRARVHLAFCPWLDASAIYSTVYYLRSDEHGAKWTQSDGTAYALPLQPNSAEHGLEHAQPEVVSITGQPRGGHSNTLVHCLELDRDGHPHLLYSFNRPYHLAREPFMRCAHVWWDGAKWSLDNWDGNRWRAGELAADLSVDVAGGCLDVVDARTMRALVMYKDRARPWLELGATVSTDGGRTWSRITPVTADAGARAAHYVSPAWARRGDGYEFLCAGFGPAPAAPVYGGTIERGAFG